MYHRYNKKRDTEGLLLQDQEVLRLLLAAKTRAQIGRELGMPQGTLNTCCTRIYRVTGCKNLPELLVKYTGEARTEEDTET